MKNVTKLNRQVCKNCCERSNKKFLDDFWTNNFTQVFRYCHKEKKSYMGIVEPISSCSYSTEHAVLGSDHFSEEEKEKIFRRKLKSSLVGFCIFIVFVIVMIIFFLILSKGELDKRANENAMYLIEQKGKLSNNGYVKLSKMLNESKTEFKIYVLEVQLEEMRKNEQNTKEKTNL